MIIVECAKLLNCPYLDLMSEDERRWCGYPATEQDMLEYVAGQRDKILELEAMFP